MSRNPAILEPSARLANPSSSTPFEHPLFYQKRIRMGPTNSHQDTSGACMFISASEVASFSTRGLHQVEPSSYVRVYMGRSNGVVVNEYAHRLVLWAMHGPPVDMLAAEGWTSSGPHCLHVCGNKDCLNPSHLVWGSARDNRVRVDAEMVYLALLEQQGRA